MIQDMSAQAQSKATKRVLFCLTVYFSCQAYAYFTAGKEKPYHSFKRKSWLHIFLIATIPGERKVWPFPVRTRIATAHQYICVSCRACFSVNGTYNLFSVEVQNLKLASIIDRPKISRSSQELINTKMCSMTAFPFIFKDTQGKTRFEYPILKSMNSKAGRVESV